MLCSKNKEINLTSSFNNSDYTVDFHFNISLDGDYADDTNYLLSLQYICEQIITPIVLFFGIIGNGISVVVLRRKRLRHTFDEVEQSATSGLVCLALSDLAFCCVGFLSVFMPAYFTLPEGSSLWAVVSIYYNNFKGPLLNIFLLTSTWLIIAISIARYMAITDPFNARFAFSVKHKNMIQFLIFVLSVLINFPQFLHFQVKHGPCYNGCYCYFRAPGLFYQFTWYHITWHFVGTLSPLVILVFCNSRLIHQIYKSLHGNAHRYSTSKITLILVSIITLFLLLVCPSMILTFLSDVVKYDNLDFYKLRMAVYITNLLQSANFAINFVLYSCISKQFRRLIFPATCCTASDHSMNAKIMKAQYNLVRLRHL